MAVAVAALGGLLREAPARALFAKSGGVALLAPLLRAGAAGGPGAPSSQLLYEAGLAIWQLSFYQPAAAAMGSAGVLPGLVELARTAPKEKVRPLRAWGVKSGQMCCTSYLATQPLPALRASRWTACITCRGRRAMHPKPPKLWRPPMHQSQGTGARQVVRVALLALRNLLAAPGLELGPEMVELGLPKVVQQRMLQARRPRLRMCVQRV